MSIKPSTYVGIAAWCCLTQAVTLHADSYAPHRSEMAPHAFALEQTLARVKSTDAGTRAQAIERLGLMRAFEEESALLDRLTDEHAEVRRDAAMSLGLIGTVPSLSPLITALTDSDWTVRQSAAVALFNLTGIASDFDALADLAARQEAAQVFQPALLSGFGQKQLAALTKSLTKLPHDPAYNLALSKKPISVSSGDLCKLEFVTDGGFKAWCSWFAEKTDPAPFMTIDLGSVSHFEQLVLLQDNKSRMHHMRIWVSDNGTDFKEVFHASTTKQTETYSVSASGRYVKLTADPAPNQPSPMFIGELEVWNRAPEKMSDARDDFYAAEKQVRALATFDVQEAVPILCAALKPYFSRVLFYDRATNVEMYSPETPAVLNRAERLYVQALIRTLGRLGGSQAENLLIELMQVSDELAYYAVQALGDCGTEKAARAIIDVLPDFAVQLSHGNSRDTGNYGAVDRMPITDMPQLSAVDRVPRAYFGMIDTLCRLDWNDPASIAALRAATPSMLATVPNDWDATVVYEMEPYQQMTGRLLEKAGVRQEAVDSAFTAVGVSGRVVSNDFEFKAAFATQSAFGMTGKDRNAHAPIAGNIFLSCCTEKDIPVLIDLLDHENGWIRISAAKTLIALKAESAIAPTMALLKSAKDDMDYGLDGDYRRLGAVKTWRNHPTNKSGAGYDEINDPCPRFKEAWLMLLGQLNATESVPLLIDYLNNERNANEIKYSAARALYAIGTTDAIAALRLAEQMHPVKVVRTLAREAIWAHDVEPLPNPESPKVKTLTQLPVPTGMPKALIFMKGDLEPRNTEQFSQDMTHYSTTDGGPTYRLARNIYRLNTADPEGSVEPLTHFKDGWVADLEVSYDGKSVLFARRGSSGVQPWWHVFSMNVDGSNLKQITHGPYSDVHPNFMPDGRILFTSSRSGIRDEYHGYPANGLTTMNSDGSDIQVIGFNIGRDAEPVMGEDGKILFTRLELFYSRMKTEWNLLSVFPDGTKAKTLYGPERREYLFDFPGADAKSEPRHRGARIVQPQSWLGSSYLLNTSKGPLLVDGPRTERLLRKDNNYAVTTPYKIDDQTLLVAAGKRPTVNGGRGVDPMVPTDLGLCYMDVETGSLTPIYNDPATMEFEARPIQPHTIPIMAAESPMTREKGFTGKMYCNSVFSTRQTYVKERGKYIRIIEGKPMITRHQTHNGGIAWRNHGGAVSRIWQTVPLAFDGSFALELPADRLFHFQVLDADFKVVGNEFIWQYARPSEVKSCIGCHEDPESTPTSMKFPQAHRLAPIACMPRPDNITYHAKMWFKGWGPDEREERMRTVNAVNLIGRE